MNKDIGQIAYEMHVARNGLTHPMPWKALPIYAKLIWVKAEQAVMEAWRMTLERWSTQ